MEQFVACGGVDCSVCSLLATVSTIFKWFLGISALTATVFIIFSGFSYILAAGNSETLAKAKKMIIYASGGFAGVLMAFLIVQFSIASVLGGANQKNWWQFDCQDEFQAGMANSRITQNTLTSVPGKLSTEIQDEKPILEDIASLHELVNSDGKIATLDPSKLNTINLKQDLLSLSSGDQIRFFAGSKSTNKNKIKQLIELNNGFITDQNSTDTLNDLQTIVTIRKDDGDLTIRGENNLADISGTYSSDDETLPDKITQINDTLKEKADQDLVITKDARSEGSMGTCLDSGGDWIQFLNECYARRENYGQEKINCSKEVSNLVMGCSCPTGTSLLGSRCIDKKDLTDQNNFSNDVSNNESDQNSLSTNENSSKKANDNDDDGDGIINRLDRCPNTPAGERVDSNPYSERLGCSCSQINLSVPTCPADRCEGNNLVTYSVEKDTCLNGVVKNSSCLVKSSEYNETCYQMSQTDSLPEKQNIAQQDPPTNDKLKDWFDRSKSSSNPDNWGTNNTGGSSGNNGSTNGGNTGSGNNNGGDRTGNNGNTGNQNTGNNNTTLPPDKGAGSFNPTPNFEEMAKCIGFKDGKVPYNGVLVTLLNKDDPTNALHPNRNASRLFYLDRYGNVIGNAGDKNAGGLAVGPWTKGSGGEAWSPEWVIFDAQSYHKNETTGSFRAGAGYRIGPAGEGMNSNGTLNNSGKPQNMSGCNMHSGNNRSHSAGCMTMGGKERQGLTQYVKSMATKSNGNIMMAVLTAENTDPNSQQFKSDYCGKMDPEKAIERFRTLSAYRNYNPNEGYSTATAYQSYDQNNEYN